MMTASSNPFLNGVFKAQHNEATLSDLSVTGVIPPELNGRFVRNGPNPQFIWSDNYHMYSGDGMLHTLSLRNGKAGYMNCYIRTPRFLCEREQGRAVFPGMRDIALVEAEFENVPSFTANTNVIEHAGRMLALNEGSPPFAIMDAAKGDAVPDRFGGIIRQTFTAHPKLSPKSGELYGFSYITPDGLVDYSVLDSSGRARLITSFRPPYAALMHDFAMTQNYAVFPVYPLTWSMERVQRGEPIFQWEPELGSYYYVLNRLSGEIVKIFRDDAILGMHVVNAYEKRGRIVLDMVLMDDIPADAQAFADDSISYLNTLNRISLNLENGVLLRDRLSDLNVEFPRIDERWTTEPYRYAYLASTLNPHLPGFIFDSISRYDHLWGRMETFRPDEAVLFGEPVFVPVGAQEGNGYLLSYGYDQNKDTSDLWIFNAMALMQGPVARVHIPHRVPYGFHGNWFDDSSSR
ncbi:carotenoid oxygenase family protein [Hahella ganghwensis]|uniref:carotenoid oxygenase family protein n=1 Tax=Hahella ganghwensis TaxID=286420 RepID=UPI0003710B0F|nr:carotenoid oxygenase family protein [Hahella ganghwensis]